MWGLSSFHPLATGTAAARYWRPRLMARGVTYPPCEGAANKARWASRKAAGTPEDGVTPEKRPHAAVVTPEWLRTAGSAPRVKP